jgi:hypothetical protein
MDPSSTLPMDIDNDGIITEAAAALAMEAGLDPTTKQSENTNSEETSTPDSDTTTLPVPAIPVATPASMEEDEVSQGSDATERPQKAAGPLPHRHHQYRYDWKIKVTPSTNTFEALREALTSMFDHIKGHETKLVVYPWSADDKSSGITKAADIPTGYSGLKKFFTRVFPRAAGGIMYASVYLGHTKTFQDLQQDAFPWMQSVEHGWYLQSLQVERTIPLGWLLYSSRSMDVPLLKSAIEKATHVEVGLRWRMISTGRKGKVAAENQVRALHLEIDADPATFSLNEPIIREMFAANKTGNFPLGIKLRLVPETTSFSNPESKAKVGRLRNRQANFGANLMAATTWEISSLDFHDTELDDRSLRDLMMDIPSTDHPHLTLFHSIDPSFKGDGHVVSFLPQMEDEARATITGLLTYLLFNNENNDRIKKFFTVSAVERAASSHWDSARQCVISEYDTLVDKLDDETMDQEYVFDNIASVAVLNPSDTGTELLIPAATATEKDTTPGDAATIADTVSTFRPNNAGKAPGIPSPSPKKRKAAPSVSSAVSQVTTETRLSTMESSMQNLLLSNQVIMEFLKAHTETQNRGLHPGHPSFNNTGSPSHSPMAGGSNVAGPAG